MECIVIGSGAMGLAAQYQLSQNNIKSLAFEQFAFVHDYGSTHGQTRAIQYGYYDDDDYMSMLMESHAGWDLLARETGKNFLQQVGKLEVYKQGSIAMDDVVKTKERYDLPLEIISDYAELKRRYPFFNFAEDHIAVTDSISGFINIDLAREAFEAAIDENICVRRDNEKVIDWRPEGEKIVVITDQAEYTTNKLIITPGSWYEIIKYKLPNVRIRQKSLCWFDVNVGSQNDLDNMPVFMYFDGDDLLYGFPPYDGQIKIGKHTGGRIIASPDLLNAEENTEEVAAMTDFADKFLNCVVTEPTHVKNCLYTQTLNSDFIIDKHPEFANVAFAIGFSGHGYKFAPAVGRLLFSLLFGDVDSRVERFCLR